MEKEDFERLRELKSLQAANCRKTKPWLKATGPRTPEGKKKVARNLPNQSSKISRAVRNLPKLEEAIDQLRRREQQSKKRQLATFEKLEKLVKKTTCKNLTISTRKAGKKMSTIEELKRKTILGQELLDRTKQLNQINR